MVTLTISEGLAAKLDAYAKQTGQSVEDMLETLFSAYSRLPPDQRNMEEQSAAMAAISGMFDDEVSDLSATVRESIQHALRKKHGRAD